MGSAGQKHAFFYVPNYDRSNPDVETQGSPLTYLRIGSDVMASNVLTTSRERGDDLLERAGLSVGTTDYFEDDSRMTQPAAGTTYFRYDNHQPVPDAKDRNDLTEQLRGSPEGPSGNYDVLARGGWRDHTDGNRITTVRGDRVDIIMGNYMRVVFGRVTGPDPYIKKAWWEVSGGHIFHGDSTRVSALTSIEWITDEKDGVDYWKVVETTHKGDCIVRYSGRVEEHFNGPLQKTQIGVDGGSTTQNPQITEERHVVTETIDTECDSKTETTSAKIITETTTGTEKIESDESAIAKSDDTGKGQPVAEFNDGLWALDQTNIEATLIKLEIETGGMLRDNGGMAIATSLIGADLSFGLGGSVSVYLGTKTNVKIGLTVDVSFALADFSSVLGAKTKIVPSVNRTVLPPDEANYLLHLALAAKYTTFVGARKYLHGFHNKT